MKIRFSFVLAAVLSSVCASFAFADDRIEDVYDLFTPSGSATHCWFGIDGEGADSTRRVSLLKGKNPLVMKDDSGQPLMDKDPKFDTVYCGMEFSGGEDSRAFHLSGSCGISKDKWKKVVISFIPRIDGKVRFSINTQAGHQYTAPDGKGVRHAFKYPDLCYVRYARMESKNVTFQDPGFSNPKKWCGRLQYFNAKLGPVCIAENGAPSIKVLKTPLNVGQTINVKKDKMVIISWYIRGDDTFKAKKSFLEE